jgi:hypothetical protein
MDHFMKKSDYYISPGKTTAHYSDCRIALGIQMGGGGERKETKTKKKRKKERKKAKR